MCIASPITNIPHHSGSCVTTDEPILPHHNHPKFVVHIMVHSWCCPPYRFGKTLMTCIQRYGFIQSIFIALKILCALPTHLSSSSSTPGNHWSWKSKVKLLSRVKSQVTQSCPTLWDPMDCSLPGSSLHGILQVGVLEWVAIAFSRGSSQPRDWTRVSCIPGRRFNLWATGEVCSYCYCSFVFSRMSYSWNHTVYIFFR